MVKSRIFQPAEVFVTLSGYVKELMIIILVCRNIFVTNTGTLYVVILGCNEILSTQAINERKTPYI